MQDMNLVVDDLNLLLSNVDVAIIGVSDLGGVNGTLMTPLMMFFLPIKCMLTRLQMYWL